MRHWNEPEQFGGRVLSKKYEALSKDAHHARGMLRASNENPGLVVASDHFFLAGRTYVLITDVFSLWTEFF